MWAAIITTALGIVDWILAKNRDDKEMAELYFKWVERQQGEYLNSKVMRDRAKERLGKILEMPFQETGVPVIVHPVEVQ